MWGAGQAPLQLLVYCEQHTTPPLTQNRRATHVIRQKQNKTARAGKTQERRKHDTQSAALVSRHAHPIIQPCRDAHKAPPTTRTHSGSA